MVFHITYPWKMNIFGNISFGLFVLFLLSSFDKNDFNSHHNTIISYL